MRERITAAFVVLAIVILLGAGTVRAFTLRDLLREQQSAHLRHNATLIAELVADRRRDGQPVNRKFLRRANSPTTRVQYVARSGRSLVVRGEDYTGRPGDDHVERATNAAGTVTVAEHPSGIGDIVGRDVAALTTLVVLVAALAAMTGWLAARTLSRPFRKLAVAAGALGRGRFDLDLPKSRIPEAEAIAESLRTSATQLQARISQERAFGAHASHVLRTPLTALRLELEEMTLRDDVPDDAKAAAARCIRSVDEVNRSAGELVALARKGSLVEGADVSLHDLATELAQRWAESLADHRRRLSASAEGDLELRFTPGPVEHVLDLVLSDIVAAGRGPVKLSFFGEDDYLRVRLPAGVISSGSRRWRSAQPGAGLAAARALAEEQGGRISGDGVGEDLEILLPRR